MHRKWLNIILILVTADAILAGWWWGRWRENRFDRVIIQAARRHALPASLIKAVVWKESRFNPDARGRAQEYGLMQVGEAAAVEWASAERVRSFEPHHLLRPEVNTQVGAWYLSILSKRYQQTDNPIAYALADYNAGRSNVLRWNKGAAATNSAAFLQNIDFPTTADYVQAILEREKHYSNALVLSCQ